MSLICVLPRCIWASQVVLVVKDLPANARDIRDAGSVPGSARSPGGGHDNPLQYSCLENPHGQRSLVVYSPWGCKESETTQWLSKEIIEFVCYALCFLIKKILCCHVVDLQCCVNFWCTAKWFIYIYINVFKIVFSVMVYHGILNIVPCAFQSVCAKSLQSCPTLCSPIDCSPPGSSVCGIFQPWVLERVSYSMPLSRRSPLT